MWIIRLFVSIERGDDTMIVNYPLFKAEVKKQMSLRDWKRRDLAKATGYSIHSIDTVFRKTKCSDELAKTIAKVLDIPNYLAS
ncbi:MAG: hypothetical protein NC299_16725 [Lachnospiraceae bacterium]|nr:hypothetical protein [Lachnospiraceae bacterium]